MAKSLLNSFESIDQTTKDILADTESPRLLAFLTLYIAKRRFNVDNHWVSGGDIGSVQTIIDYQKLFREK